MRFPTLLLLMAAALPAQAPKAQVAFAAGANRSGLAGFAWLCGAYLPSLPAWPSGLDAAESIVVHCDERGITIAPNAVPLPAGAIAVGSIDLPSGVRALCSCASDGGEDWFVPVGATMPPDWEQLVGLLRARELERAHTIDLAAAVGHLLGPSAEGEARSLQIGATLCGEVTWQAWTNSTHLRVRGRSEGGLTIPAALLLAAQANGVPTDGTLALRAFVARDGDRQEAVRQLSATDPEVSHDTLIAMLYGTDELRLTAIDSLVRQRSAEDLPRIVSAASPSMPLAVVAAADAVHAMWADASASDRDRTRAALASSPVALLRGLDPERAQREPVAASRTQIPWRLLFILFLAAATTFPLWLRERARTACFDG
ncbi:MAG: hypothetical protein U1E73_11090 [Planctomycetota bacterium]